jgi:hypothetical protein
LMKQSVFTTAMFKRIAKTIVMILLFSPVAVNAVTYLDEFSVFDRPNDQGDAIIVMLPELPDNILAQINGIRIYRSEFAEGPFSQVGFVEQGAIRFVDSGRMFVDPSVPPGTEPEGIPLLKKTPYHYRLATLFETTNDDGTTVYEEHHSVVKGPVEAVPHLFHTGKMPILVGTIALFMLVGLFIQIARSGKAMYVRPISGMDEIDNAIGRATEMGKPILYVLGLGAPQEIATIASYTILARVARKTAEYGTDIIVPCNEPIVMTIAQETVKSAYTESGHSDAFNEDMVFFVTSMQFAFVAAVNGIMLREKTATNCYFGKFYAESLLLSETGNIAGSIQVAGTDEVAQLPFFVTTCDYTLIGEELYAASAYLGRDPLLLGALKAQDVGKAVVMILIIVGSILVSFNIDWLKELITASI